MLPASPTTGTKGNWPRKGLNKAPALVGSGVLPCATLVHSFRGHVWVPVLSPSVYLPRCWQRETAKHRLSKPCTEIQRHGGRQPAYSPACILPPMLPLSIFLLESHQSRATHTNTFWFLWSNHCCDHFCDHFTSFPTFPFLTSSWTFCISRSFPPPALATGTGLDIRVTPLKPILEQILSQKKSTLSSLPMWMIKPKALKATESHLGTIRERLDFSDIIEPRGQALPETCTIF